MPPPLCHPYFLAKMYIHGIDVNDKTSVRKIVAGTVIYSELSMGMVD